MLFPFNEALELRWSSIVAHVPPSPMKAGAVFSLKTSNHVRRTKLVLGFLALCGSLTVFPPTDSHAKVKPPRVPRPEPELKIVNLNVTPTPYTLGNGPLQFSVTVQLPKGVDGDVVLEVTSLISSPSKTSLRFLTYRQPVQVLPRVDRETERSRVSVDLAWDGQDHRRQPTAVGTYSYEVRTKLLATGDKGLRTVMVAWPKRGTLEVK